MPQVEINGTLFHADLEDSILDVARKEKSHIGYSCGGNGACQTCEVVVHEGMEALSEINPTEMAWLTPQKREEGHRLACQAKIVQDGIPIRVTTRVQMLMEIFTKTFNKEDRAEDTPGPDPKAVSAFIKFIGKETVSHLAVVPSAAMNSAFKLVEGDYSPSTIKEALKAWREQIPDIEPRFDKLSDAVAKLSQMKPENLPKSLQPVFESAEPLAKGLSELVGNFIGAAAKGNPFAPKKPRPGVHHIDIEMPEKNTKHFSEENNG
ncbi:ferredoxin [Chloroherpeton thalassium ATCC 35110]|uniref:Ferredoxin n=1 Tax=Chloroherpeton thalassium (strain ATCC 35110 / GB-78) TaxID=517418 RepID=B3QZ28_CHLT3|nr:2Fe-2S iron-sulfur cluster-binding protein [Chloroherpeton thalassium]ACF13721.1 ferredoxin [Chloroherpeton thalassium ATCC 35110]